MIQTCVCDQQTTAKIVETFPSRFPSISERKASEMFPLYYICSDVFTWLVYQVAKG